jgi:hypothetical protein
MLVADIPLKDQVDATHSMPDTYTTVVARAQLAQQFCDHAREQTRACENLVHDQHLQQQGASKVLKIILDMKGETEIWKLIRHLRYHWTIIVLLVSFGCGFIHSGKN